MPVGYIAVAVQVTHFLSSGNGTVLINANTLSRTASGTTTFDLIDAVNTTLALTNSGAGAADPYR